MTLATVRVPIGKVDGRLTRLQEDILAVEEPLEIRVGSTSLSVTMRTPDHDFDLAAGFLFAENIITSASQIRGMTNLGPNIVVVELSQTVMIEPPTSQRGFMMTSACGLCGKVSLESLAANRCPVLPLSDLSIDAAVIHRLPGQLVKGKIFLRAQAGSTPPRCSIPRVNWSRCTKTSGGTTR